MSKELIVEEGLSTRAHEKPVASKQVIRDIIKFAWLSDEYNYQHPRTRIQVVFALLLFYFLGLRPGDITVEGLENEGLLYQDISLFRQRTDDYQGLVLRIRLRNRKGKRDNEADT